MHDAEEEVRLPVIPEAFHLGFRVCRSRGRFDHDEDRAVMRLYGRRCGMRVSLGE